MRSAPAILLLFSLGCNVQDFDPRSPGTTGGEQPETDHGVKTAAEVQVYVKYVNDGDTFYFTPPADLRPPDGKPFPDRVRLLGVNAPEVAHGDGQSDQCYGQEAKRFLKDAIEGEYVTLVFDPTRCSAAKPDGCRGHYGRILAYIRHGGALVNEQLIRGGYVRVYRDKYFHRDTTRYRDLEDEARAAGVGLWGDCE